MNMPLPAEAVAERGAGQQEDGESERVRVDDPLELLDATRRGRRGSTGRAVVTTRLSSTTMKSAIEVIANVQSVRVPAFIVTSRFRLVADLVTDYSASS